MAKRAQKPIRPLTGPDECNVRWLANVAGHFQVPCSSVEEFSEEIGMLLREEFADTEFREPMSRKTAAAQRRQIEKCRSELLRIAKAAKAVHAALDAAGSSNVAHCFERLKFTAPDRRDGAEPRILPHALASLRLQLDVEHALSLLPPKKRGKGRPPKNVVGHRAARFDRFVVSVCGIVWTFDGNPRLDKNYLSGALPEFLNAVRHLLRFIPPEGDGEDDLTGAKLDGIVQKAKRLRPRQPTIRVSRHTG